MAGGGRKPSIKARVLAACLVSLFIKTASAASYVVGDGWTTPIADPDVYSKWVHGKTFYVGDVLVFQYKIGHTVAEVTKPEYDHCAATNPISIATAGPVEITLNTPGDHYFICTFPGHCGYGQKVAITALAAAHPHPVLPHPALTPTSAPAPTPAASATPPPSASDVAVAAATPPPASPSPPKSGGVGVVAGLVMSLLFAAAGFLLCL